MGTQPQKRTREERQREKRQALISAGLRVVAKHGYTKASVQRITSAAGLAQGSLYSHFGSHREFLDELLPEAGRKFFRWLDANATLGGDFFEDQHAYVLAVFRYLQRNRYFMRVMTDAECAAPESYAQYMQSVEQRYLDRQYAAEAAGQLRHHTDAEFRVVAEILSGALGHIAIGFGGRPDPVEGALPSWAADTYVRFLRHGIGAPDEDYPVESGRAPQGQRQQNGGTRTAFLDAAARVVMRHGFAGANVTEIADEAGLSVGALYTHFESQQQVFDELLDHVRVAMLDHVRGFTRGARSFAEREYRGFVGFFDFLAFCPWYIRIESEAAVWAPETYRRHFYDLADSYVALLRRARADGELAGFEDRDLPVLAYVFMAARHYIAARYVLAEGGQRALPDHVAATYRRLLQRGLARA